jgi:hypothetical protein
MSFQINRRHITQIPPRSTNLLLGKKKKSQGAKSGE